MNKQAKKITHYGILWHRDDVYWGKQGRKRQMLGRLPKQSDAEKTNFGDFVGLYALYKDRELLHVDYTCNRKFALTSFAQVLAKHNNRSNPYWNRFSWFGNKKALFSDADRLSELKTDLILDWRELVHWCNCVSLHYFNYQVHYLDAKKLIQVPHEDAKGSSEKSLNGN